MFFLGRTAQAHLPRRQPRQRRLQLRYPIIGSVGRSLEVQGTSAPRVQGVPEQKPWANSGALPDHQGRCMCTSAHAAGT
eukprot:1160371-Pelagomonas_calceolata.AAC.2